MIVDDFDYVFLNSVPSCMCAVVCVLSLEKLMLITYFSLAIIVKLHFQPCVLI